MTEYAIGIDFGTTKSLVSYIPRTTPIDSASFPMYASFSQHLSPSIADSPYHRIGSGDNIQPVPTVIAIDQASEDMQKPRLIPGFAALTFNEEGYENYHLIRDLKQRVASQKNKERIISLNDFDYPVEGIVAHFLCALRKYANELKDTPLDKQGVTITVPAKSEVIQRMTMRFAAKVAGFNGQIDLLEEPVAAFLYHRHIHPNAFKLKDNKLAYALVIDMGGGTSDLAVVEYESKKLPRVIGRAMARFGGEDIDKLFLETFWLQSYKSPYKTEPEPRLLNHSQLKRMNEGRRALLYAYVRTAKEALSNGLNSYIQDVTGAIPGRSGLIKAPQVFAEDLRALLKNKELTASYPNDRGKPHTLSVENHLAKLIDMALQDAKIKRHEIHKLIFAGGSIRLPGIRDLVIDFFTSDKRPGTPHRGFSEATDIHDKSPEACVAGGAAIHQLYRHHKNKKWRKVIEPTLSSEYKLVHYRNNSGEEKFEQLGKAKQTLPINRITYPKALTIHKPTPWPNDGKLQVELRVDDLVKVYSLPDNFVSGKKIYSFLEAILVRYRIDEFGILEIIQFTPGVMWRGFNPQKSVIYRLPQNTPDLEELLLTSVTRIETLKSTFIPSTMRLK